MHVSLKNKSLSVEALSSKQSSSCAWPGCCCLRRSQEKGVCLPRELTTVEGGSVFWETIVPIRSLKARAMTSHSPGVLETLGDEGRGQQVQDQHVS